MLKYVVHQKDVGIIASHDTYEEGAKALYDVQKNPYHDPTNFSLGTLTIADEGVEVKVIPPTSSTPPYVRFVNTFTQLQLLVGGYVEFGRTAEGVHFACNEDGALMGEPVNEAFALAFPNAQPICGTIVILSSREAIEALPYE